MGIFTDESHVERVQTADWEEKRHLLDKKERELLTEQHIRDDLCDRFLGYLGIFAILAVALFPILLILNVLLKEALLEAVVRFLCLLVPYVIMLIVFGVYAIRYGVFKRRPIHVFKDDMETIKYCLSRRRTYAKITFRQFKKLYMPNKDYYTWSKQYKYHFEDMLKELYGKVYVVTFDHVRAVEVYPCHLFRWEHDAEEDECERKEK